MRALLELGDEPAQERARLLEQPWLPGELRERVDLPAEPVGHRLTVALDETVLGERLERARHLTLLAIEVLGDARDAHTALLDRLVGGERQEHLDAPADAGLAIGRHGLLTAAGGWAIYPTRVETTGPGYRPTNPGP